MSYSPSNSSKQSIKPSLSPSLSPQKGTYNPYLPAPLPIGVSGPGGLPIMAHPHHPDVDMEMDDMYSDDEQSVRLDDGETLGPRHYEEEGEMEMDEMDIEEPEEAEEGVAGWKCAWSKCGKIWKDQQGLVKHLHKDHIGINREWYSCKWDDCRRKGDKQATRHALITHLRAHTGERPYTCTQPNCFKTFTRSDAMNKHLRSIHNVPAELANPRTAARIKRSTSEHPEGNIMDGASRVGSPAAGTPGESSIHPGNGTPSADQPYPSEVEKLKAKPRSRTTSGKKPASSRSRVKKAPIPPVYLETSPTHSGGPYLAPNAEYPIRRPTQSQPPVTVGPDGVTYIRFGSDADLMTDPDLYEVLPRLRSRPVLNITHDDISALDYVRLKHPRRVAGGPRTWQKSKKRADGQEEAGEDDGSDDSFDEGTAKVHPDESGLEIGRIGEAGVMGERSVFGRSRWAAKYIMAKAKLMLAEEEMRMRLGDLNSLLEEEEGLRQTLDAAVIR